MKYILKKVSKEPSICIIDDIVTEVNDDFAEITGYSGSELKGKTLTEVGRMIRVDSQINLQNIKNENKLYIFTKSLKEVRVAISCIILDNHHKKCLAFRRIPCPAIEEKYNFAQQFYADRDVGTAIFSAPDLILLKANQKYIDFTGGLYNKVEDIIGRKQKEIVNKFEKSEISKLYINALNDGKPYYVEEFERHINGHTGYWNISVVPIFIKGKMEYVIQTALDVTDKVLNKRAAEQVNMYDDFKSEQFIYDSDLKGGSAHMQNEGDQIVRAQLSLLKNIIENLELGFVRFSYPEFKIIDCNSKSYSYLKHINPEKKIFSPEDMNFFDLFNVDEKDRKIKIIQHLIESKGGAYFNIRKINTGGEEKFYKYMYQPLFGLNNQVLEIIFISMDITEEVKAKNKMETIIRMQDEFFVNVSHEIKTPLNVISSASQLMRLYLENNEHEANKEKILNYVYCIKQNCYRLVKLINNILDLSKIKSGFFRLNLSNENIVKVTEDIVQAVADYIKGKGLNIVFDTDTEEKFIACDPDKIERIMLNLISNAIKFSNPGGSIFVSVFDRGDAVEIDVKDTGIGIEKKYLKTIFERYRKADNSLSRNAEGSGIGLALTKSIIEMQGGIISVESEPGKGSIFKVKLPATTVSNSKITEQTDCVNDETEMINVELSDIY